MIDVRRENTSRGCVLQGNPASGSIPERYMVELIEVRDRVLLSALQAALTEAQIAFVTFDGPISGLLGDMFPHRIMVDEVNLVPARRVVALVSPDDLPPLERKNP